MSRTRVLDTPFSLGAPPLRAGAELDVESLRQPGEHPFAGLLYAFNVAVFTALAVAIYMARFCEQCGAAVAVSLSA